jgi:uncharacterized protein (DUF433 family)
MSSVVTRNREILGGTAVFAGTRVPVRTLIDCLEGGYTIDEFLEDFPTVKREQVITFLEDTKAELELAVPASGSSSTSAFPSGSLGSCLAIKSPPFQPKAGQRLNQNVTSRRDAKARRRARCSRLCRYLAVQ